MNYVIFLDLDGTLIDYKTNLPLSAARALNEAIDNGNIVFICTGCSKIEIEARNLPNVNGYIGGNGCYIEYNNQVIFHKPISKEACKNFVNYCESNDLAYRLECNEGMFISDDYEEKSSLARFFYENGKEADVKLMRHKQLPKYMIKGADMIRSTCNKTAFVLNDYSDFLKAKEFFKEFKVETWGGKGEAALYGSIMNSGIDKYTAIKKVMELFPNYKSIAFGDGVVDIPMFKACDIGIAMGNASQEVKDNSTYITDDVDSDGLYNAFKHFNVIL